MADPDFSTWLTKQQAADQIGVTTKSLEAYAKAGKVQSAFWQREGRGQTVRGRGQNRVCAATGAVAALCGAAPGRVDECERPTSPGVDNCERRRCSAGSHR